MGVHVDDAGGDEKAVGVDRLLGGGAVQGADFGDGAVVDRDVGGAGRGPRAVDDRAAPDDQVVHVGASPREVLA